MVEIELRRPKEDGVEYRHATHRLKPEFFEKVRRELP